MHSIIRTYSAGVFMGEIDETTRSADGKRAIVKDARRLWYWSGAASLSQLAMDGTTNPKQCKFPIAVPQVELMEIIEVIPITDGAKKSIDKVKVWEM